MLALTGLPQRPALVRRFALLAVGATVLTACNVSAGPPRTVTLTTLNGSGVVGTVSFSAVGERTAVEVKVSPGGNLDMPAHIHPVAGGGSRVSLAPRGARA